MECGKFVRREPDSSSFGFSHQINPKAFMLLRPWAPTMT